MQLQTSIWALKQHHSWLRICPPYFAQRAPPEKEMSKKVRLFAANFSFSSQASFAVCSTLPYLHHESRRNFLVDTYFIQPIGKNLYWSIGIAGPNLKIELRNVFELLPHRKRLRKGYGTSMFSIEKHWTMLRPLQSPGSPNLSGFSSLFVGRRLFLRLGSNSITQ